ncbi:MAG: 2-oxoacid:ferredoxin oxidoreductase, gamma subunit [Promethearchaeota archaeon]|jgi:2-oxoglutarate ferredoxin oxidoreductase subunit gamma|nr:MAG: 2-oxoacid:ferredoxin oxidoreductase, gamma subunit [Candidatus Lokiarchaeota archaeon]
MARYEVRIAGFGGQGVITLSKMIITASSLHEGLAATQTEAYSAAARGGKCWAEVVVDRDKDQDLIDYPKALEPYDFLIILSDEAASEVGRNALKKEDNTGYLIWDPSTIKKFRKAKRYKSLEIPVQKISLEKFGKTVFGNAILFGAFTAVSKVFSEESAIETLKSFVPKDTLETNLEAFELGKKEGEEFLTKLEEEDD